MIIFNDPFGERKAQSPATFTCGVAGLKYRFKFKSRYTSPGIRNINKYLLLHQVFPDLNFNTSGTFNCIHRI